MSMTARFFLLIFTPLLFASSTVFASSDQAYQDYLYQSDQYRSAYSQFLTAKNEYLQYKTLTSQTAALQRIKDMIIRRDVFLASYVTLLAERVVEESGLLESERAGFLASLASERFFFDTHAAPIDAIASIADASSVNTSVENHYPEFRRTIQRTRLMLTIASLRRLASDLETAVSHAQTLLNENRSAYPPEKQSIIDRWFLQIGNKRTVFQQKLDGILAQISLTNISSTEEVDRKVSDLFQQLSEAKQYLSEATTYINELLNAMRYLD